MVKNLRKTSFGIEKIFDSIIYAPLFKKLWKFLNEKRIFYRLIDIFYGIISYIKKVSAVIPFLKVIAGTEPVDFSDFKTYLIAQSHLDAAWLWTVQDSKIRAYKTFYKAIEHIEKYPFFRISLTSPLYYSWIKKYDKNLWDKVKKTVKSGKMDIFGGSWIEPDLNCSSGESIVRQRLYGQLFYLRNFGKFSRVEALPDTFGFPSTLPQILVKSGADSFWTTKLTWNDSNLFPVANFMWRGPDGSEIFTHMFKFNEMAIVDFGLYKKTGRRPNKYNLVFNSRSNYEKLSDELSDTQRVSTAGLFYGVGDGGKGPIELEIDLMENLSRRFNQKHTTAHNFFDVLKKDVGDKIVTWNDELYLEYHRGCLTTQADVKKGNRMSENLIIACEMLSVLFQVYKFGESKEQGGIKSLNYEFPKKIFDDCWKKIMLNQFHDILAGSSIPEVYIKTRKDYNYVIKNMNLIQKDILKQVFNNIPHDREEILVYNPIAVNNETTIKIGQIEVLINNLEPLSLNILNKNTLFERMKAQNSNLELFNSDSVITFQNKMLKVIVSRVDGQIKCIQYLNPDSSVKIPNILYGERNGLSLPEIQLLRFKGARLKVYEEDFSGDMYPAWNLDRSYIQRPITTELNGDVDIEYKGKDRIIIKVPVKFKKSTALLRYILRKDSNKLEINIRINLKDPRLLLKYFIPMNVKSNEVVCEIPYGNISRPRVPSTKMEAAKWEFGIQKWLDICDTDYGIAVFNDSKYGVSANKNGISLTLVRSPPYPKSTFYSHEEIIPQDEKPEYTDLGEHELRMAILPHRGTWIDENIPAKALAFNNPPIILFDGGTEIEPVLNNLIERNGEGIKYSGILSNKIKFPRIFSEPDNIIVSAIKPSEWIYKDQGINEDKYTLGYKIGELFLPENPINWAWDRKTFIIRVFESCGIETKNAVIKLVNIPLTIRIENVEETDLLERKISDKIKIEKFDASIERANGSEEKTADYIIETDFGKHEIKTFRLIFS